MSHGKQDKQGDSWETSVSFFYFRDTGSYYFAQAGHELSWSNSFTLDSPIAGPAGTCYCTQEAYLKTWKKKKKNCQPRILYPAKISFRNEGERETSSDIGKMKGFINSRPTLQETLKEVIQAEGKWYR